MSNQPRQDHSLPSPDDATPVSLADHLEGSPEARIAFEQCDGTPADYWAKLVAAHDLFDELAVALGGWLEDHGLSFEDFAGLVAGVREAELLADDEEEPVEPGQHDRTVGSGVRTRAGRVAVRSLFLRGINADDAAAILGLPADGVSRYLNERGFSPTAREVVRLDREGVSRTEIARRLNVSRQHVYDVLQKAGVQVGDGRSYTDEQKRRIVRGYRAGRGVKELAEATGLKKSTVVNVLRSARDRGELPEYPRQRRAS